jgi:hypothetical protein
MVGKLEMYSFHPYLNSRKNPLAAPDMSLTVHKGPMW